MTTRVFRFRLALCALGTMALACPPSRTHAGGHCAAAAAIVPIEGRPGWFQVETPAGRTTARWPAAPESSVPAYVIHALDRGWDADGNTATAADTVVVPAGSTVRWQLVSGIHTLTSGRSADDPGAGAGFDYLLDEQHPLFDSTFTAPDTVDFFCFFHEPSMRGVLIVTSSAGVPPPRPPTRLAFTAPPRPNPSLGTVSFDIGLPRDQNVRVEVLDLLGVRVALLHDGPLEAGNHPFRWRGVTDRGARARSGVYLVMLTSGALQVSREVSLLR
jgi:plastocyanin